MAWGRLRRDLMRVADIGRYAWVAAFLGVRDVDGFVGGVYIAPF